LQFAKQSQQVVCDMWFAIRLQPSYGLHPVGRLVLPPRFLVPHLPQFGISHGNPAYPHGSTAPRFITILWPPQPTKLFHGPSMLRSANNQRCPAHFRHHRQDRRPFAESLCWADVPPPNALHCSEVERLRAAMPLSRSGAGHGPICGLEALMLSRREICTSAPKESAPAESSPQLARSARPLPWPHFSTPPGVGLPKAGGKSA
jgi:hypothetical protein